MSEAARRLERLGIRGVDPDTVERLDGLLSDVVEWMAELYEVDGPLPIERMPGTLRPIPHPSSGGAHGS